jgi:hypothetical protein
VAIEQASTGCDLDDIDLLGLDYCGGKSAGVGVLAVCAQLESGAAYAVARRR